MALHFNYEKITDKTLIDHPSDPDRYNPVFDSLIWLTMSCGFNKITEDNVEKVYQRVKAYQLVFGPCLRKPREGSVISTVYITHADVKAYIGLTTNASTLTDSAFAKRVMEWVKDSSKACNEGSPELSAVEIFASK
jgi:hypothetical protein